MKELTKKLYTTLGLVVMLVVCATGIASAQSEATNLYVKNVKNQALDQHKKSMMVPLSKVLEKVGHARHITFVYEYDLIEGKTVSKTVLTSANLAHKLGKLLAKNGLTYLKKAKGTYVIKRLPLFHSMRQPPTAAQITGTVTDGSNGETLPGVNIAVKGTTTGTATDAQGQYELTVESLQDTLVFSFVGYQTQTVPINGRTEINIAMQSQAISGEEMVVVGYSEQEKQNISGSIDVVDVDKLAEGTSGTVSKQLQGMASGVTVISSGQPGENPMVRIRGINTFGNNSPLYVVDGIATQDIDNLDPSNIKSMQVLKDAAAASIYGSRASNGVIIVTTKQGKGEMEVEYTGFVGYNMPKSENVWDILKPQEMANLKWKAIKNGGGNPAPDPQYGNGSKPVLPYYIKPAGANKDDVDPNDYYLIPEYTNSQQLQSFNQIIRANKVGTNWYKEIFSPALSMNHKLSVSGGGEQGSYLVSLGYLDDQGTLNTTYNRRLNFRVNTQFNVNENFQFGENLNLSLSKNPRVGTLSEGSPIGMSYREQPIIPVRDIAGNFAGTIAPQTGNALNPVFMLHSRRNNENENRQAFGNIYAKINFLDDFSFKINFGGQINSGFNHSFSYPSYARAENSTTNSYSEDSNYEYNWIQTNTLIYSPNIGNLHNLKVLIGEETNKSKGRYLSGQTKDYYSFNPSYVTLSTGSGIKENNSSVNETTLLSYFGRIDYSYDNKYIFSVTLRRDGSSKFGNNKWGTFPAGSIAWRISQEEFINNISWVSDLKIKLGYGIMGNQLNVNPNNAYTLYVGNPASSYYPIDGSNSSTQSGFQRNRIGNLDAKWEKDRNGNIGIDASFLSNKLNFKVEYYWKNIKDLLYNPELIGTTGTTNQPFVNVGSIKNTGIDATLSNNGSFDGSNGQYHMSLNITSYVNEITQVSRNKSYFAQDERRLSGNIIRNEVGHPISSFYGYKIAGFFNSQSEITKLNAKAPGGIYETDARVGTYRYTDINNDNQISPADRTFLGNANPDFTYGISGGINYKDFDFSIFFYGSKGNDIYNNVKWYTDFYSNFAGAKSHAALYDSWTPNDHDASLPIQTTGSGFSTSAVPNSYFVEDGSYFRLKNVILGYTIPNSVMSQAGITKLRIYAQATNIFTLTGYTGLDPEIAGNSTDFGVDMGTYASTRQFTVGINLSF